VSFQLEKQNDVLTSEVLLYRESAASVGAAKGGGGAGLHGKKKRARQKSDHDLNVLQVL
jgi:hypothetical protein